MKQIIPLLLIGLLLSATSCNKDEESGDVSLVTARDNIKAEILMNDMYKIMAFYVLKEPPFTVSQPYSCMENIEWDYSGEVKTITMEFGDENCEGPDGRIRNGNLLISFTGEYEEEGAEITITPDGYSVDDFEYEGEVHILNSGMNANDQITFEISTSATVTAPLNDYTFTWNSTHTRTWIAGMNSNFPEDDVYELMGQGAGQDRTESSYTFNIISPIEAEFTCLQFRKGIFDVDPAGKITRVVNFGDGTCDNKVVITVNNRDYNVDIE